MSEDFDTVEFVRQFQRFLHRLDARLPAEKTSVLVRRLTEHLGREPHGLPVVTDSFPVYDHANVQVALDRYLDIEGRGAELIGVGGGGGREFQSFTELIELGVYHQHYGVGAVDYVTVPVGIGEERTCVRLGVYPVSDGAWRFAVLLRVSVYSGLPRVTLEVLAPDPEPASRFLAKIRELIGWYNIFRGKIVSIRAGLLTATGVVEAATDAGAAGAAAVRAALDELRASRDALAGSGVDPFARRGG